VKRINDQWVLKLEEILADENLEEILSDEILEEILADQNLEEVLVDHQNLVQKVPTPEIPEEILPPGC